MLDLSHFPNTSNGADIQIFNALGLNDWQTWVKPRGKSHLTIIAIGSGGGGGGGFSGAAATARGGGGGGGASGISRLIIPISFLPDNLYLNVGLGGIGGAPGSAGGSGGFTFIQIRPDSLGQNRVMLAVGSVAGGGGGGSSTAAGAAGSAAGANGPFLFSALGLFDSNAGIAGGLGGSQTGTAGTPITWGAAAPTFSGGGGGGGTTAADFAGGGIIGGGWFPTIAGGLAGPNRGQDGFFSSVPFGSCGGTGGGASNTSNGGNGGNAAIGSGGGGGGGGVTAGSGGNGGNGLVIMQCW